MKCFCMIKIWHYAAYCDVISFRGIFTHWSFRVTLPWPVLFILKFVLTVAPEELMCPTRSLRFDEGLYVSDRLENCNVQYVIWLWNLLNTKWGSIFYINIIVKKKKIFSYIIYFTTFSKYFVYDYTKLFFVLVIDDQVGELAHEALVLKAQLLLNWFTENPEAL